MTSVGISLREMSRRQNQRPSVYWECQADGWFQYWPCEMRLMDVGSVIVKSAHLAEQDGYFSGHAVGVA